MEIEFSDDTNRLTEAGKAAWLSLKEDKSWDHWRALGYAIDAARRDIRHSLGTPNGDSKKIKDAMGIWLRETGFNEIDKGARSRLQSCIEHATLIEAWRATLTPAQRVALNHPDAIWRKFKVTLEDGLPSAPKTSAKDIQIEGLQHLLEKRNDRIAELESEQIKGDDAEWDGIGELRAARERIAELEAHIAEETRLRQAAEAALADERSEAPKPMQRDLPEMPLSSKRSVFDTFADKGISMRRSMPGNMAAHVDRSKSEGPLTVRAHLKRDGTPDDAVSAAYQSIIRYIKPGAAYHHQVGSTYLLRVRSVPTHSRNNAIGTQS